MNFEFKTHENYKLTFSQPANCTLRVLDKNWKSYFRAIKDWNEHPDKYFPKPKLPKYLKKDARFPGSRGSCFVMEIVYETEIPDVKAESNRIASIDLGVDNLVTMTNNIGLNPIIINGKGIKSINQYYNKRLAKEKSLLKIRHGKDWSKKLDSITFKRYQRINS